MVSWLKQDAEANDAGAAIWRHDGEDDDDDDDDFDAKHAYLAASVWISEKLQ